MSNAELTAEEYLKKENIDKVDFMETGMFQVFVKVMQSYAEHYHEIKSKENNEERVFEYNKIKEAEKKYKEILKDLRSRISFPNPKQDQVAQDEARREVFQSLQEERDRLSERNLELELLLMDIPRLVKELTGLELNEKIKQTLTQEKDE